MQKIRILPLGNEVKILIYRMHRWQSFCFSMAVFCAFWVGIVYKYGNGHILENYYLYCIGNFPACMFQLVIFGCFLLFNILFVAILLAFLLPHVIALSQEKMTIKGPFPIKEKTFVLADIKNLRIEEYAVIRKGNLRLIRDIAFDYLGHKVRLGMNLTPETANMFLDAAFKNIVQ